MNDKERLMILEIAKMLTRASETEAYYELFEQVLPDQLTSMATVQDLYDHVDE